MWGYNWKILTEETSQVAAAGGQLEVLRFLKARGCGWNSHTCKEAARAGSLDCLKYEI
jgi:hypothetical protein